MNLAPGMKAVVAVEGQSVMVFVTEANLASVFAGRPYDPEKDAWGVTQVYTYEQVLAVVQKRQQPTKTP